MTLTSRLRVVSGAVIALAGALVPAAQTVAAQPATVPCYSYAASHLQFKVRPSTCVFPVRNAPLGSGAGSVFVNGMRWTGWGGREPAATGTERGNMDTKFRARVRLSKRITCGDGSRIYTSVRITDRDTGKQVFAFKLEYNCPHAG